MKSRSSFLGVCQYYFIAKQQQKACIVHLNQQQNTLTNILPSEYHTSNKEENVLMTSDLVSRIDTLIYWQRQGVTFLGIRMPLLCETQPTFTVLHSCLPSESLKIPLHM